jgi:hypothetical protein
MEYTTEMLAKAEFFQRAGSCSLSGPQKKELAKIHLELTGNKLNESCATCCRDAMRIFVNHLNSPQPMKEEKATPVKKVSFTGVKQTKPKTTRKPRANASKKTTSTKA